MCNRFNYSLWLIFVYCRNCEKYRNEDKEDLKQMREILHDLAIEKAGKEMKRKITAVTLN